jgi:diamine N-acetyltransferase
MEIQKAKISDLEIIKNIGRLTFFETFAEVNTEADMNTYLEQSFSDEKLNEELLDPNSEFYFALDDEKVIGYLKINFGSSQTEQKDKNSLEIERIYVLKEYHGKKVGQVLYDCALKIAKEKQVEFVWLGVWEKNPRAISFYTKNGFIAFDKHVFVLGTDVQTDIMMKLTL